jgi:hypothetical protein
MAGSQAMVLLTCDQVLNKLVGFPVIPELLKQQQS